MSARCSTRTRVRPDPGLGSRGAPAGLRPLPHPRAPWRILLALATLLVGVAAGGCASAPASTIRVLDARIDKDHRSTFMGLPLRTGQVILSEAPGAYSFFFALVPKEFHSFTHAGVIVMEGGEPFVYDVSGDFSPGCYDRPTDGIVGGLRRQSFLDYCRPNLYMEIYDPPLGVDPAKVEAYIAQKSRTGVVFDPYFRSDEQETLYCTEFVDQALRAGGFPGVKIQPSNPHPDMVRSMAYLAVPPGECVPAALFLDPKRYVGAVGIFGSRTAAKCYFEAKREIHRRFTPDQKLGNLFENDGGRLWLLPNVEALLTESVHLFDGARIAPSDAAIAMAVRALAEDMYGPLADRSARKP